MHEAGYAHSIEVWRRGGTGRRPVRRVARRMFFGESMFHPSHRRLQGRPGDPDPAARTLGVHPARLPGDESAPAQPGRPGDSPLRVSATGGGHATGSRHAAGAGRWTKRRRMQEALGNKQFFITPGHACSYLPGVRRTPCFSTRATPSRRTPIRRSPNRGSGAAAGTCTARTAATARPACRPAFPWTRSAPTPPAPGLPSATPISSCRFTTVRSRAASMSCTRATSPAATPTATCFHRRRTSSARSCCRPGRRRLFVCSYLGDELVAVAVTDRQPRGLSAIYTFFDPDLPSAAWACGACCSRSSWRAAGPAPPVPRLLDPRLRRRCATRSTTGPWSCCSTASGRALP
jgi:hypothetical protein